MTKDPAAALAAATDSLVAAAANKDSSGSGSGSGASNSATTAERIPAPPLVPLRNVWLAELTARIRSRPIPWEGYQRADLVSAEELKLIKKVDAKGNSAGRGHSEVAKISDSVRCVLSRGLRRVPASYSVCARALADPLLASPFSSTLMHDLQDAGEYALLYLRLLAKLSRTDTLQQILVLVGDMLQDRDDRVAHFYQARANGSNSSDGSSKSASDGQQASAALPWGPFLK